MGCALPVPLSGERPKVTVSDCTTSPARRPDCSDLALQTALYKRLFVEDLLSTWH